MNKEQKATVPAQAHTTTDDEIQPTVKTAEAHEEGTTYSKKTQDTINVLKKIKEEAEFNLFSKWYIGDFISLLNNTFNAIAGIPDKDLSEDYLIDEWSRFSCDYIAAYHTRDNFWALIIEKEDREKKAKEKATTHNE
jgi:hypothetical protein